jgi:AGCS family alanine or glycine:cation symporter
MIKWISRLAALLSVVCIPNWVWGQESPAGPQGLDERINEWFTPIAETWGSIIFYPIQFTDTIAVPIVVILLVGGALFFTLYFAFVNLRKFPLAISVVRGKYDKMDYQMVPDTKAELNITETGDIPRTIRDESHHGEVNHFQALATAVSGTVGLGNIAGVAVAVSIGGPGATFWMVVCGLLGMSSKFVECTLGVKYRDIDANGIVYGGPMYYLSKGLKEMNMGGLGKILAIFFAIFCVGGSFGGGNAFQANQAAAQIMNMTGIQTGSTGFIIGLIMAILVGVVIIGGIKRIANVTEKVVPVMALLYVVASLIILMCHFRLLDDAITLIFTSAFAPSAAVGGFFGVLIQGFRRAVFSNEAGTGSAAIAHSAVKTRYPASEGLVSLLEPFIDTVVICTMTALVIVVYNMNGVFEYGIVTDTSTAAGVGLTSAAYNDVIPHFSYVLTVAVVLFAFSTMISWSYYGLQSWKYLFGRSRISDLSFKFLFLVFVVIGASASLGAVIDFSDAMIFAMVFPNMLGLFLLAPKVKQELSRYIKAIKASKT